MYRINYRLLQQTRDFINANPEAHDQEHWVVGAIEGSGETVNVCGSTACFAGWASIIAGHFQVMERDHYRGAPIWFGTEKVVDPVTQRIDSMEHVGQDELGLTDGQADCMFHGENTHADLNAMVDALELNENANLYEMGALFRERVAKFGSYEAVDYAASKHNEDMDSLGLSGDA